MIVPPLKGLNMCFNSLNPGLAPWAMQEYCPKGLTARTQQFIYTPQTHLTNTIPRHNTANAQYDNEPCKGDTPA